MSAGLQVLVGEDMAFAWLAFYPEYPRFLNGGVALAQWIDSAAIDLDAGVLRS